MRALLGATQAGPAAGLSLLVCVAFPGEVRCCDVAQARTLASCIWCLRSFLYHQLVVRAHMSLRLLAAPRAGTTFAPAVAVYRSELPDPWAAVGLCWWLVLLRP
jgi:hypothetical protein